MKRRPLRIERLARREERDLIKRILTLSIFSAILIVFIFTLGITFLGKLADLLSSVIGGKADIKGKEGSTLEAPRLEQTSEATNSAKFTVSGFSGGVKVKIILNDEEAGEAGVADGKFKFEDLILAENTNEIKVKALDEGAQSDFSEAIKVTLDKKEPKLEIESPVQDQSFSGNNRIKVSGSTEADAQVYANGFLANINTDGKFEVFVPLLEGENNIDVKAIDEAGNVKVEKRKINFHK